MTTTAEFVIGCKIVCTDGPCGELRRIVVDPVAHTLTHLVVEPAHRRGSGHLVPIALVTSTDDSVHLHCTLAEFDALDDAEEARFVGGASGQWPYGRDEIMSWPYYNLELEGVRMAGSGAGGVAMSPSVTTVDRVPLGKVEVRRGEPVHASDGEIGHVQGLIIDRTDHLVTHVLLAEGHLWGHKTVAIPISAVGAIGDGVRLDLSKSQVRDLPAVAVARPE
jgi:sporulation protein YlmC with PRC-barrel domain